MTRRLAATSLAALLIAGVNPAAVLATDPPVVPDVSVTTLEDHAKTITLSATDPDGGGAIDHFDIQVGTAHGGLGTVSPIPDCTDAPSCTATVTYTPDDDYNGSDSFEFTATDVDGDSSGNATATITITPVNDTPSFTKGANQTVLEDDGPQSEPGWATNISAGPADESGQTVTFEVTTNTNPSLFADGPDVAANGTLTYTPADDANGSATIGIRIKDDGGTANAGDDTSGSQTFTISVTSVNDAPSFVSGIDEVALEDSGSQSDPGWATSIKKGPSNESGQTINFLISSNSNPSLFTSGPAVSASGTVTFTPADDANGSATIGVKAHDNGGIANGGVDTSAAQTFTITITPVNDAPSFTKGANQTALEDAGAQSEPGWATNISAGPADESGQALTFEVASNSNPSLFADGPDVAADGTLTYTPADDANGSATIGIRITDDGGTDNAGDDTSGSQTFTISVTSVNDAPSFTSQDTSTPEQSLATTLTVPAWATNVAAGPADESGQGLTFEITSNDKQSLFSIQPSVSANGTLTFRPVVHGTGTAHLTVRLQDDGGTTNSGVDTSAEQSFAIDVSGVNDPPIAGNDSVVVRLGGATNLNVLTNDIGGPGEPADTVYITSVSGASRGYVTITGGGTGLSYDPLGCSTGVDVFTYTIHDSGTPALTASATIVVTINGPASHPFADGPRPGFVTGSTIGSTTPVKLYWCGLTSGTSVKSYRIYQSKNGGSFKTLIKSTTGTSSTRNLDNSPDAYQFRTKITDKKGHTSTGTGPKFRAVRTQDTSGSIVYSTGWAKSTKGSPSGGSTHATSGTNKTATFTFTGRAFAIVGTQAKHNGSFSVYLDGVKVTTISEKSKKTHEKKVLYARTTTAGSHTIQIRTSGNGRVDLDAILSIAQP